MDTVMGDGGLKITCGECAAHLKVKEEHINLGASVFSCPSCLRAGRYVELSVAETFRLRMEAVLVRAVSGSARGLWTCRASGSHGPPCGALNTGEALMCFECHAANPEGDPRVKAPGAAVRVKGLVGRPEMNGAVGVAVGVDAATRRVIVRLAKEGDKKFRAANLEIYVASPSPPPPGTLEEGCAEAVLLEGGFNYPELRGTYRFQGRFAHGKPIYEQEAFDEAAAAVDAKAESARGILFWDHVHSIWLVTVGTLPLPLLFCFQILPLTHVHSRRCGWPRCRDVRGNWDDGIPPKQVEEPR